MINTEPLSRSLSIGEAATASGLTVSTVRYYEGLGVIACSERVGGKRRFDESVVNRLRFIRATQRAGFTLGEIARLLDDETGGWRGLVDKKISEVSEQRELLDAVLATLTEMRTCGCEIVATCELAMQETPCS